MRRIRLAALLVMATLATAPATAQETRGNINGTVQDASGVIPGATITITNADTGQTQTLVTNSSGYFEAPLLQAGQYRVTVEMPNFKGVIKAASRSASVNPLTQAHPRSRRHRRTRERLGQGADPRHDLGVVRTELRSRADLRSADGVEHADSARAIRAGRGQSDHPGAGHLRADRRPDQRRGHGPRRRRQLQLHDRRRDQCRQQPPHRQLAELRHDRGDARRDVELRRLAGARHRRQHLDDDARGLERAARHGELPVLDQQDQFA